jgi:hypothetical protein
VEIITYLASNISCDWLHGAESSLRSWQTFFPQPCARRQSGSSPLSRSANQIRHIPLAAYCLLYIRLPESPTNTYLPWRWQLQCLPKRWTTFNIRRSSSPKADVLHVENSPPLDPIRSHMIPVYIVPRYCFEIHFNNIHRSTFRSPSGLFASGIQIRMLDAFLISPYEIQILSVSSSLILSC